MGRKYDSALDLPERAAEGGESEPLPEPPAAVYSVGTTSLDVRVTLKKAHTHAGVDHPTGAEITVRPDVREWLIAHGVVDADGKPGAA